MPGLVDFAWRLYSNSGPALQTIFIGLLVLGWRLEIQPRLDRLETAVDRHENRLEEKALTTQEQELLLENAHERLDDADQTREKLRQRLTRLEHAFYRNHDDDDVDDDEQVGPDYRSDGAGPMIDALEAADPAEHSKHEGHP